MKKNILYTAVVAIIVSLVTTGIYLYFNPGGKTIKIEHIDGNPVAGALYSMDGEGNLTPVDFTEVAEKVMPAVVHIRSTVSMDNVTAYNYQQVPDPFRDFFGDDMFKRFFGPPYDNQERENPVQVSTGSGVIINEKGYIVTNHHVIDNATDIEITLNDNRTYKASVVGADPLTDLALLQVKEEGLSYLAFDNSDQVKVGEWVLAVGNPFNLNSTVTAGIVSAKSRNINILREQYAVESFIQTDAAINPGNSGGALVDLNGALIGINTAIASPTGAYSGYGFAVPSNIVSKVVEDLLKFGAVQRGYLGITIRSMNSNLAKEKGLDITTGVYVDSVLEKSAAMEAGIKPGDVIYEIDGVPVKTSPELQEIVARHKPGDKVPVKLKRKNTDKEISVTLKNREGTTDFIARERSEVVNTLGAEFEEIKPEMAKKMDIDGGVRVKRLYPGKLRQQTNMREGFIITKIDGQPVRRIEDVEKSLQNKEGGVLIEGRYEDDPSTVYYGFGM